MTKSTMAQFTEWLADKHETGMVDCTYLILQKARQLLASEGKVESKPKECPYSDDGKCAMRPPPSFNKGNDKGLVEELEAWTKKHCIYDDDLQCPAMEEFNAILAKFRGGK